MDAEVKGFDAGDEDDGEGLDAMRMERELSEFEESDKEDLELFGDTTPIDAETVHNALDKDQEKARGKRPLLMKRIWELRYMVMRILKKGKVLWNGLARDPHVELMLRIHRTLIVRLLTTLVKMMGLTVISFQVQLYTNILSYKKTGEFLVEHLYKSFIIHKT